MAGGDIGTDYMIFSSLNAVISIKWLLFKKAGCQKGLIFLTFYRLGRKSQIRMNALFVCFFFSYYRITDFFFLSVFRYNWDYWWHLKLLQPSYFIFIILSWIMLYPWALSCDMKHLYALLPPFNSLLWFYSNNVKFYFYYYFTLFNV